MSANLARVVRARSDALADRAYDLQEEVPADLFSLIREVSELGRVLARVVDGKPVPQAFGAPGDWGYGTPIGNAVLAALRVDAGIAQATKPNT